MCSFGTKLLNAVYLPAISLSLHNAADHVDGLKTNIPRTMMYRDCPNINVQLVVIVQTAPCCQASACLASEGP